MHPCADVDVTNFVPRKTRFGLGIETKHLDNKIELCTWPSSGWEGSKRVSINKFIVPDNLFFECLGLWEGDGGKSKGLHFSNSCPDLLLVFLSLSKKNWVLPEMNLKSLSAFPKEQINGQEKDGQKYLESQFIISQDCVTIRDSARNTR